MWLGSSSNHSMARQSTHSLIHKFSNYCNWYIISITSNLQCLPLLVLAAGASDSAVESRGHQLSETIWLQDEVVGLSPAIPGPQLTVCDIDHMAVCLHCRRAVRPRLLVLPSHALLGDCPSPQTRDPDLTCHPWMCSRAWSLPLQVGPTLWPSGSLSKQCWLWQPCELWRCRKTSCKYHSLWDECVVTSICFTPYVHLQATSIGLYKWRLMLLSLHMIYIPLGLILLVNATC